jgi:hypothetical protein
MKAGSVGGLKAGQSEPVDEGGDGHRQGDGVDHFNPFWMEKAQLMAAPTVGQNKYFAGDRSTPLTHHFGQNRQLLLRQLYPPTRTMAVIRDLAGHPPIGCPCRPENEQASPLLAGR